MSADSYAPLGSVLLDRYLVVQPIGQGGRDAVFEGLQMELERPVAIKMLSRELSADVPSRARFQREARLAGLLTHPNTVTTFDCGETEDGILFMVREFLQGRSVLQAIDSEGALPWRRALHIIHQVCGSLAEAHEKGIYHRDLKLGNIFLLDLKRELDRVKVLDYVNWRFFLSRTLSEGPLAAAGRQRAAAQADVSRLMDEMTPDPHGDIYGMGVVTYELLTGTALAEDEQPSVTSSEEPPALEDAGEEAYDAPSYAGKLFMELNVPPEVGALVAGMLTSGEGQGLDTVWQVREAIERILEEGT